jgi:hypothetical protein
LCVVDIGPPAYLNGTHGPYASNSCRDYPLADGYKNNTNRTRALYPSNYYGVIYFDIYITNRACGLDAGNFEHRVISKYDRTDGTKTFYSNRGDIAVYQERNVTNGSCTFYACGDHAVVYSDQYVPNRSSAFYACGKYNLTYRSSDGTNFAVPVNTNRDDNVVYLNDKPAVLTNPLDARRDDGGVYSQCCGPNCPGTGNAVNKVRRGYAPEAVEAPSAFTPTFIVGSGAHELPHAIRMIAVAAAAVGN